VLVPIALLVRTLLFGRLFGSPLEFLLYPGSIFLFDASRHYGLTAFGLSLMATVALYAFAAMILFAIFGGKTGARRFVRRHWII
jgi:hypothetical protein